MSGKKPAPPPSPPSKEACREGLPPATRGAARLHLATGAPELTPSARHRYAAACRECFGNLDPLPSRLFRIPFLGVEPAVMPEEAVLLLPQPPAPVSAAHDRVISCLAQLHGLRYCPQVPALTLLLLSSNAEEEAFAIVEALLRKARAPDASSDVAVTLLLSRRAEAAFIKVFRALIKTYLPKLSAHLEALGSPLRAVYASWFRGFFSSWLPEADVARVVDAYLSEGCKVLLRYGLALLKLNKARLLQTATAREVDKVLRRWAARAALASGGSNSSVTPELAALVASDVPLSLPPGSAPMAPAPYPSPYAWRTLCKTAFGGFTNLSRATISKLLAKYQGPAGVVGGATGAGAQGGSSDAIAAPGAAAVPSTLPATGAALSVVSAHPSRASLPSRGSAASLSREGGGGDGAGFTGRSSDASEAGAGASDTAASAAAAATLYSPHLNSVLVVGTTATHGSAAALAAAVGLTGGAGDDDAQEAAEAAGGDTFEIGGGDNEADALDRSGVELDEDEGGGSGVTLIGGAATLLALASRGREDEEPRQEEAGAGGGDTSRSGSGRAGLASSPSTASDLGVPLSASSSRNSSRLALVGSQATFGALAEHPTLRTLLSHGHASAGDIFSGLSSTPGSAAGTMTVPPPAYELYAGTVRYAPLAGGVVRRGSATTASGASPSSGEWWSVSYDSLADPRETESGSDGLGAWHVRKVVGLGCRLMSPDFAAPAPQALLGRALASASALAALERSPALPPGAEAAAVALGGHSWMAGLYASVGSSSAAAAAAAGGAGAPHVRTVAEVFGTPSSSAAAAAAAPAPAPAPVYLSPSSRPAVSLSMSASPHLAALCALLPDALAAHDLTCLYSTDTHGWSLATLYARTRFLAPLLVLVQAGLRPAGGGAASSASAAASPASHPGLRAAVSSRYPVFGVFSSHGLLTSAPSTSGGSAAPAPGSHSGGWVGGRLDFGFQLFPELNRLAVSAAERETTAATASSSSEEEPASSSVTLSAGAGVSPQEAASLAALGQHTPLARTRFLLPGRDALVWGGHASRPGVAAFSLAASLQRATAARCWLRDVGLLEECNSSGVAGGTLGDPWEEFELDVVAVEAYGFIDRFGALLGAAGAAGGAPSTLLARTNAAGGAGGGASAVVKSPGVTPRDVRVAFRGSLEKYWAAATAAADKQ